MKNLALKVEGGRTPLAPYMENKLLEFLILKTQYFSFIYMYFVEYFAVSLETLITLKSKLDVSLQSLITLSSNPHWNYVWTSKLDSSLDVQTGF